MTGGNLSVKDFTQQNFFIQKITASCFVKAGTHQPVHMNRAYSGLAIMCDHHSDFTFDGKNKLTVRKNDIIFLPQGSNYIVTSEEPGDCYAINFLTNADFSASPTLFHTADSAQFMEMFKNIEVIWKNKKPGYDMKCMALLYNIFYKLQSEYSLNHCPSGKQKIILPAVDYIHENYATEVLTLSGLSEMCGITPEYFRSIFKQAYGTSPVKYINHLKLSRAEELLKSNLYSVTEAAIMSGFNDISHFSREFKKAYGVSPSDYAKQNI